MEYKPGQIEVKWRKKWQDAQIYKVEIVKDKPKYYVLDMFPYPSGAGLHVGHPLGYIATDIFSRYKRQKGFNVLHPMGYDAFGLPAEQYAIQTGVNPKVSTEQNTRRYREQLDNLGLSYDWSREVNTSDPDYYKWTQWIFIQLYEHYFDVVANKAVPISSLVNYFENNGSNGNTALNGDAVNFSSGEWKAYTPKERNDILMNFRLAYKGTAYVNWCEELGTVLANDEVKDGVSERGGFPVIKRPMENWFLRITAYADRLLGDLDKVEWSEALKSMQENWIGRSEGAQIFFKIDGKDEQIEVFTTRPDTIFGANFLVLAPEHDLVKSLVTKECAEKVDTYINYVKTRSERERMSETKQVTGEFTGSFAIHPFSGAKIPIWIAEYVLKDYGTGAIMAVPSGDLRDQAFASKFKLAITEIIDRSGYENAGIEDKVGVMINSNFLNGMEVKDAIKEALARIEEQNIGSRRVNYKLRDANFSRQRYWGEPMPVYYDKDGVCHPLSLADLPLRLPDLDDFKPGAGGQSPLSRVSEWVNIPNGGRRETDTMPGFAGSSWYFLRYMDAKNDKEFAGKEALEYWRDVDLYVGGTEHAVGHLMYSRFWHKMLYDLGYVPTVEPFMKLINQGMIQGVSEFILSHHVNEDEEVEFISYDLAKINIEVNETHYTERNIDINLVKNSTLNIEAYIKWRPEFQNAKFICEGGYWQGGIFNRTGNGSDQFKTKQAVEKMSKSKYNVVNPDELIAQYGCDCFRMYEMFLGPVEDSKPWNTQGIDGVNKFFRKLWSLYYTENGVVNFSKEDPTKEELKVLHKCIKKVNEDIERFSFNTCVSSFMICVNELRDLKSNNYHILLDLAKLIAPFGPHTAEELWEVLGQAFSVINQSYPEFNPEYLVEDNIEYPVCINGKKRATLILPNNASDTEAKSQALEMEEVKKWLDGNEPKKVILVPKKMINIVI